MAGVVDLFGGLTREELTTACVELAFKTGDDATAAAFETDIDAAIDSYHLVAVGENPTVLVAGPVAFPELPEGAVDLPHILDIESRTVDPERKATAAETRFRADAASAVESGDGETIERLLDVSYELDVWGPVDLAATRDRLDEALEE